MDELTVTKSRFKHDGLYSLKSYYNLLYDLLRTMGFDVEEKSYVNKLGPDGKSSELEISWVCTANVDDYARIRLHVKTLIVGMGKQQTQIDGKPVTQDVGSLELELKSFVDVDYKNKWASNYFLSWVRDIYDKYFYKSKLGTIMEKSGTAMKKVDNEMKAFFNMQRFM